MTPALPQVLALVIGVLLPLLTGLVTRSTASSNTRAVTLLGLSAVTSVLTELADTLGTGAAFDVGASALAALGTFVTGVGIHFGLLKGTALSEWAKATSGFIGRRDYDLAA